MRYFYEVHSQFFNRQYDSSDLHLALKEFNRQVGMWGKATLWRVTWNDIHAEHVCIKSK